jgi:hypothetical protein
MSEQDTQDGYVSRRKVLAGTGSAIATLGVSRVAGANVDDADKIEIPATGQGGEVIRYNTVPKKWWNHILAARRQSSKLAENIPEADGVAKEATDDTIAGRKKRQLVVQFPDEEARDNARVPDKAGGFPVKTDVVSDVELQSCKHIVNSPYFHGGALLLRLDNHQDLGTCYDTGHGLEVTTAGCVAELKNTGDKYIFTTNHQWDYNTSCGQVSDVPAGTIVDRNGNKERYPCGNSSVWHNPNLDYMFVYNQAKSCWQGSDIPLPMAQNGKMYTSSGTILIAGYTMNLDQYTGTSTTFYRPTHRSGYQNETLDRDSLNLSNNCVSNSNGYEFDVASTQGDSGGVYYRTFTDRWGKQFAEVSALHLGSTQNNKVGTVNCSYPTMNVPQTDQYQKGIATSIEDVDNDVNTTVYWGGQ